MSSETSPRGSGGRAQGRGGGLDQALEAAQPRRGAQGSVDDAVGAELGGACLLGHVLRSGGRVGDSGGEHEVGAGAGVGVESGAGPADEAPAELGRYRGTCGRGVVKCSVRT